MFCCCTDSESAARSRAAEDVVFVEASEEAAAPVSDKIVAEESCGIAGDASAVSASEKNASKTGVVATSARLSTASNGETAKAPSKPKTATAASRARRTSVPLQVDPDEGAFLVFDSESGKLNLQWSQTPVPQALAWLSFMVQVPAHKYRVSGGKQTLCSDVNDDNKYCEGWMRFILTANEYPAKLMLFDNFEVTGAPDVQVLQLVMKPNPASTSKTDLVPVPEALSEYNKLFDLKNVKAVAVVPLKSSLIEEGKPTPANKFLQMGQGEGAAASLQMKIQM